MGADVGCRFTVRRTLSEAAGGKSLNENSPKGTNTPEETAELSGGYLDRVCLVSDRLGNREAEKSIEKKLDYVKAREKYSPLWTFSGSEGGIKEKEAALKKEAPAFGLKEKLNYATDAEYGSAVSSLSAAGLVGTAASTFASAAANDPAVISKAARGTFWLKGQSPPLLLQCAQTRKIQKSPHVPILNTVCRL